MEFKVYILYSERLGKFYVGQTSELTKRIDRHNEGRERYTRAGIPWVLVYSESCRVLEKKIKNLRSKRYLASLGLDD
ncbi:GIY-YIG nuclease family protein [Algoriphagus namhaensis]